MWFGPTGARRSLTVAATGLLAAAAAVPMVGAIVTRDLAVAFVAVLGALLLLSAGRPWIVVTTTRLWRNPTFGPPLRTRDLGSVFADGVLLKTTVEGEVKTLAIVPYGAWFATDMASEAERLQALVDQA